MHNGDLCLRITYIRKLACEHLVHNYAERVYIASGVRSGSSRLFRRDVMHRAHGLVAAVLYIVLKGRNAEIGDLYHAVLEQHDILRFYVPVDYPFIMGVVKRFGYLSSEAEHLASAQSPCFLQILL